MFTSRSKALPKKNLYLLVWFLTRASVHSVLFKNSNKNTVVNQRLIVHGKVGKALYDHNHVDPSNKEFLNFKAGDILTIIESDQDLQGWLLAVNSSRVKGFVPGNYIDVTTEEVIFDFPWHCILEFDIFVLRPQQKSLKN
jgi:hypothetical protein